jgi:hypothetical protein
MNDKITLNKKGYYALLDLLKITNNIKILRNSYKRVF